MAQFLFDLPDKPTSPSEARHLVRKATREAHVDDDTTANAVLAVSELVTNALSHGSDAIAD